jgi:formylglycine-generating enzyme
MNTTVLTKPAKAEDALSERREMAYIPAGPFRMGASNGSEAESPIHEVYVSEFWLDVRPVSNADFSAFVEATGHRTTVELFNASNPDARKPTWLDYQQNRESHPVVCVSWDDAAAYAAWCGKRLPTEAEWEKAARGGLEDAFFPWGNAEPTAEMCTWKRVGGDPTMPCTTPANVSQPNGYGLRHMAGNVWNWCHDWFADDYYRVSPSSNPTGPADGKYRVRRGGAWNVREAFRLRCANRGAMSPEGSWPNLGFRCAADKMKTDHD